MLKDQIMKASVRKLLPVVVPEWDDVTVYVRKLSVGEVNRLLQGKPDDHDLTFLAELVAKATTDESGQKLFTVQEAESLSFEGVQRVAEAVMQFNNMGPKAVEAEKKD